MTTIHDTRDSVLSTLVRHEIPVTMQENRRYYCRFSVPDAPIFAYRSLIERHETNKIKIRVSPDYVEMWVA